MKVEFKPNQRFYQFKEQFPQFLSVLKFWILQTESTRFFQQACIIFIFVFFIASPLAYFVSLLSIVVAWGLVAVGLIKLTIELVQWFSRKRKK